MEAIKQTINMIQSVIRDLPKRSRPWWAVRILSIVFSAEPARDLSAEHLHGHTPRRIMTSRARVQRGGPDQQYDLAVLLLLACTVQCPKEIKITNIMYALSAVPSGKKYPKRFPIAILARSSQDGEEKGRTSESQLVMNLMRRTNPLKCSAWPDSGSLAQDRPLLAEQESVKDPEQVARLLDAAGHNTKRCRTHDGQEIHLLPGCSSKNRQGLRGILPRRVRRAGHRMEELEDWNCCGATAYMAVDETKALCLAARNLAMAEAKKRDVVAPCSGCYLVLENPNACSKSTRSRATACARRSRKLACPSRAKSRFATDRRHDQRHWSRRDQSQGQNPAQGSQIARTTDVRSYAPMHLRRSDLSHDDGPVVRALGAEIVDYPLKTRCCGGASRAPSPRSDSASLYSPPRSQSAAPISSPPAARCVSSISIPIRKTWLRDTKT